ncbi:SH3 domain-containing protein [Enterococcus ureasiticus]|uniref:peptidoglycan amidohydrolase family protein n=1 Tax=Enterococcus ureasiticus TaxID=903984 RepID=UPI001A90C931|nr:peptidoglycan amidohydrolase family protein [Enterococcus ureasiticus]MBO0475181.1 SH3 domain-containing protein [Enterococcus ureasiticus]
MSLNKQLSVRWFDNRKGKLTYSMTGSRNGYDGTADCSGSTTQSIKDAGGKSYAYLYSTVTLGPYLKENGYEKIAINQEWDAKEGDIVMMSWGNSMADSAGAGGHVGIMKNDWDFISVDYWTGGQAGTAVSEHNIDYYLNINRPSYFEVWRLKTVGGEVAPMPHPTPKPNSGLISKAGTFYPDRQLSVSSDTNPDGVASPALDYYNASMAIPYDSYIMANGYAWISYVAGSGNRRYVAVGPDDGRVDTTWGTGFFN